MQSITIVAIPSSHPGGLDAPLGAHFGHCDLYTLVKIAQGKVQEVATLPNVPHEQGGCMAPVNHLAQNGVQVLIAGGMGPSWGSIRWASTSCMGAALKPWERL